MAQQQTTDKADSEVSDPENASPEAVSATPEALKDSISRAMGYLDGRAGTPGDGRQFGDYVIFCGLPIVRDFPEYEAVLEPYKEWIAAHDRFEKVLPYQSACHVMGLDLIGQHEQAVEIFEGLKQFSNEGKWLIPYHIGWDLYGCIVAEDEELLEKTMTHIANVIEPQPHRYQYFVAYCLWKAFEKTKDDEYREMFLTFARNIIPFEDEYVGMTVDDGHAGMVLTVFARAFGETENEGFREISKKLAEGLLASQMENGSWNDKTAYTVMPAEGLAAFLKFCL